MSLERLAMFDSSLISGTDQITWGGSEDEVYQERLTAALKAGLEIHKSLFEQEYQARMRAKFGLLEVRAEDEELIRDILGLLQGSHADYSIVFRELGSFSPADGATNDTLREHFLNGDRFTEWTMRYRDRLWSGGSRDTERGDRMTEVCAQELSGLDGD